MTTQPPGSPFLAGASARLLVCVLIGAVAGAVFAVFRDAGHGLLLGIALAEALFVVVGWIGLWRMDSAATERTSRRDGAHARMDEIAVVGFAVAGLVSIVLLLLFGKGSDHALTSVLSFLGALLAWASLHLMYASRYAREYFAAQGGIDFNDDEPPTFQDFFYFSYNLGMTYQVSDTSVSSRAIRAVVLRHTLLSYLFGTVVLATTINLVVSAIAS
ncbi:DUF1345 domain-containing protein [uncultured Microbacterium sp.]|uniref:DUF1345 domain-containing protein n=1 Tax=uncultured Microbacterium sp. TaxID=191216 RepID=UPI0025F5B935|nr:DUF1345 domain-containing protein [uncultured Microbacterium sp.]